MRSPLLAAALCIASPAWAGPKVVLQRDEWLALQPPEDVPPAKGPGPVAADREVVLEPIADGVHLHARWRLEAPDATSTDWFDQILVGPNVQIEHATLDGRPAPLAARDGGIALTTHVTRPVVVAIDAFIPGSPEREDLSFHLMPAARGHLEVHGTDLEPFLSATDGPVVRARDGFRSVAGDLTLHLAARQPPIERPALALAEVGIGLTVGDAELSGRAHLVWHVRQGKLAEVTFTATGIGTDLAVTGEDVGDWRRDGDRVTITLRSPDDPEIVVDAVWSQAVPRGDDVSLPVPSITVEGALHSDTVLQLARDSEIEVIPQGSGWEPLASSAMPDWADGLITGTPTASFRVTGGGGSIELLRFTPVEEPACVVDVANYTVATSDEGRTLIRAYLEVRNERAAALRVIPPAGHRLIAVQVSGQPVVPGSDGGDGWLVPLPRSVETVEGLLSFPIEVIVLGDTADWERHEERTLELLRYDAPVALSRLTLHLPPGYASRLEAGDGDVVADFTEGETITYGQAVGDVASAAADAKFQEAVAAWMRNDFDTAQSSLDELRSLGAETENVKKLQSNLDVINDVDVTKGDDVMARRVKEQAQARAIEDTRAQDEALHEAEEAERAGDYGAASSAYNEAIAIGDKLAKLEQTESVEVASKNASASSALAVVEKAKEKREEIEQSGQQEQARVLISEESIELVPTGRTFESSLQSLPGVAGKRGEGQTKTGAEHGETDRDGVVDEVDSGTYTLDGLDISGLAGGVEGGVVGGTVNGMGVSGEGVGGGGNGEGGPIAYNVTPVEPPPPPEPEPPSYDYEYSQDMPTAEISERRRLRVPLPHLSMKKVAASYDQGAGYAESYAPTPAYGPTTPMATPEKPAEIEVMAGEEAPPQVTAAAMTVLVPALGQDVRFQHLLLPPDDTWTVTLKARSED